MIDAIEWWHIFLLVIVLAPILNALTKTSLAKKAIGYTDFRGIDLNIFIKDFGSPVSNFCDGEYTIVTWRDDHYLIALKFDSKGLCFGVVNEEVLG